jgi:hypothetical protein
LRKILKRLFIKYRAAQIIIIWAAFFTLPPSVIFAQEKAGADEDSALVDSSLINRHSPKKATIMSAIVPGAGQFYNHKYWKIPIIYAGLGACAYYIWDSNNKCLLWEGKNVPADQKTGQYDFYRRRKELNIIMFCGMYVLNIIDATVDGYLFDFDVTKSLSLHISPAIYQPQSVGIMCSFKF